VIIPVTGAFKPFFGQSFVHAKERHKWQLSPHLTLISYPQIYLRQDN